MEQTDDLWACPLTARPLESMTLASAEGAVGGSLVALPRRGTSAALPIGPTETVLVDRDRGRAYPVLDGIPVLLSPERVEVRPDEEVDLDHPNYAEAYAEMAFYNAPSPESPALRSILQELVDDLSETPTFPEPASVWVDAPYDGGAQLDCYERLAPLDGRRFMQLGGSGLHAVKFLLGGADRAVLVTPMIAEAKRALWLAEAFGVVERLDVALGLAEELPCLDGSVDGIFSGGCAHHMQMDTAMPQIRRVLRPGGSFVAAEPWEAPLYRLGTGLFGKREANAHCTPLTADRLTSFYETFEQATAVHHGAISRYPMIALGKLGLRPSRAALLCQFAIDDRWADRLRIRRHGSSVALLATRSA